MPEGTDSQTSQSRDSFGVQTPDHMDTLQTKLPEITPDDSGHVSVPLQQEIGINQSRDEHLIAEPPSDCNLTECSESELADELGTDSKNGKRISLGRAILEIVILVAAVFVFSLLLRAFVFHTYAVPTGSMDDTIAVNDMIVAQRVSYYFTEPAVGDIITFTDPLDSSRTLVKRVIATEGQTIDLINGSVYVDGVCLDEPYTDGKRSVPLVTPYKVSYPYTVPTGSVWVMGDNRTNSQDSRYFGAIEVSSVYGKAAFVYWPISHIGSLE